MGFIPKLAASRRLKVLKAESISSFYRQMELSMLHGITDTMISFSSTRTVGKRAVPGHRSQHYIDHNKMARAFLHSLKHGGQHF
ncbi:hypothetical protein RRG08_062686 [Elysia crispata]|uniref:Uncharacterized protein n=1 Tax=Elysia crispata TaxID=231223 RepID=A0AAE0XME3_9GAST|nr:hypothetical protein RRG08_062686 [Elysia crispata]